MKNYEDAKKNCKEKFGGNGKLFEPKTWSENEMAQKVKKFVEQIFAIYLCGEVSKKGCRRVCPFERKRNWISGTAFLYFNSNIRV